MYQTTIVKVATVALAAAASSAAAHVSAENSATSHTNTVNVATAAAHHDHPVGTPVASVDAKPSPPAVPEQQLTNQEKNARVREAARNLLRKKAEFAAEEAAAAAAADGSTTSSSTSKAERKRRAAENMRNFSPEHGTAERLSAEEINRLVNRAKETDPEGKLPQNQWIRRMAWYDFGGIGDGVPSDYKPYDDGYADPGYDWPMWAQAYRMLGGFIDCDWQQGEDEPGQAGQQGGRKRRTKQNGEERDLSGDGTEDACGRWMMWAAVSSVVWCSL